MSLLNLSSSFEYKIMPEGERILEVTKASAFPTSKPREITITYKDCLENGAFLTESYNLENDKALFKLTCVLRGLYSKDDLNSFDTNKIEDLIGKKIIVDITHTVKASTKHVGETVTFCKISKVVGNNEQALGNLADLPTTNDSGSALE